MQIEALNPDLRLGADGIWYSNASQAVSYPSTAHDACFSLEDNSFWFRHRNDCIAAAVKCFPPQEHEAIFDIGGGNGFVSKGLEQAGFEVVLLEPGPIGAANARKRGVKQVVCASTETAKLPPGSLGAFGLFDVIEHIEDDHAFLAPVRALMKKDGRLYATVPAYQALWSKEDADAGHFRRYALAAICAALVRAGFEIDFSTYNFRPLPLPIFLMRALPHRLGLVRSAHAPKDDLREHAIAGGRKKTLIETLLRREVDNIAKKRPMRFGGSCLVVARVP
jgi:SAM-dependent methyltransferase